MRDDLVGSTIAGRYRVVRKLGEGGMGAVYTAIQEPLGREIALKVIRSDLMRDAHAVERFRREATTLSQLAHPNVVTIFDFGNEGGVFFLAMELLRGESLRQRVNRTGALPPLSTVSIVRDIASGLAVAHAAGVIHRDLKPDNIMLVDSFGRGETAKILDFGVAKLATTTPGATLTQVGMLVGTPGYMAPELTLHGITNDPRSDLYALGVMWFEMLVGRALFEASTPVMLVMKHATEEPPRPSELVPSYGISGELEELVLQLLAKEPERRPASAADLVRQLDAIADLKVSALPRALVASVPVDALSPPPGAPTPLAGTPTVPTVGLNLASFRSIPSSPSNPSRPSTSEALPSIAAELRGRKVLFAAAGAFAAVVVIGVAVAALNRSTAATATSATVTSSPVASAPVTSATITSAPVANVTSAPHTRDPVTSSSARSSPHTSAPVTSSPVSRAPVASRPATRAPVASTPVTRAPSTTLPSTPATPAPSTATSAPSTRKPHVKPVVEPPRVPIVPDLVD